MVSGGIVFSMLISLLSVGHWATYVLNWDLMTGVLLKGSQAQAN